MAVNFQVSHITTYRRHKDPTQITIGKSPRQLNENPEYYGRLTVENQLDLNLGKENWKDEGGGEKLESILTYCDQISSEGDSLKEIAGDFICTRSLLRNICVNWKSNSRMQFKAYRTKDVIFLCEIPQEETWDSEFVYYGYKFEHYMTLNEYGTIQDKSETPTNAEQEKVVCKSKISYDGEEFTLFYGAEVDAIDKDGNFVELKTRKGVNNREDEYRKETSWYRNIAIKTYFQSYFGGIDNLILGQWNDQRIVYKVDRLKVDALRTSEQARWDKDKCMKEKMSDGPPKFLVVELNGNQDAVNLVQIMLNNGYSRLMLLDHLSKHPTLQSLESTSQPIVQKEVPIEKPVVEATYTPESQASSSSSPVQNVKEEIDDDIILDFEASTSYIDQLVRMQPENGSIDDINLNFIENYLKTAGQDTETAQPARKKSKLEKIQDPDYHQCQLCQVCVKSKNGKWNLQMHVVALHSKSKMFQCPECKLEDYRKSTLRRHSRATHGEEIEPISIITREKRLEWNEIMGVCFPEFATSTGFLDSNKLQQ